MVGVPLSVIGLVFTYLALQGGDDSGPASTRTPSEASAPAARKPATRIAGIVVNNDSQSQNPSLDVALHNVGAARSVLTRARITVKEVSVLPVCFSQGTLDVTGKYDVTLPARRGTVEVPLHQQIGPDAADRIVFDLGASTHSLGVDRDEPRYLLYRLGIAISDDGGGPPIDGGTVLVSLPYPPGVLEIFWPKYLESKAQSDPELRENFGTSFPYEKLMPCWRRNTALLRRALNESGTRSSELADVRRQLANTVEVPRP